MHKLTGMVLSTMVLFSLIGMISFLVIIGTDKIMHPNKPLICSQ